MTTLVRGERRDLTHWEHALRLAAFVIAAVSVAFAAFALWGVTQAAAPPEFPFTTNTVAKEGILTGLCALVVIDVRRWGAVAVPLLILAHMLLATTLGYTDWQGVTRTIKTWWVPSILDSPADTLRLGWEVADVAVVLILLGLNHMAIRSRYNLRYLTPAGFRSLMALAEVLVLDEDPSIKPAEVAKRVDVYLEGFRAREKWKIQLVLNVLAYRPLLALPPHPPIWLMSPATRERWLRRVFFADVAFRRGPDFLRRPNQAMIRVAQQFVFFGYYGDERAARKVGYLPFSERPGAAAAIAKVPTNRPRVRCLDPANVVGEDVSADVVIVGTGAGGAMLAHELARRGREVLMLERGAHIDPSEFTENEATQLSNLYADGALTVSKDFELQVAQGMCVGGSTVVNNALCFDIPDSVLDRWIDPTGLNAGLDGERLRAAFAHVRAFLQIGPVGPPRILNPGGLQISQRLARAGSEDRLDRVDANIVDCLGCGYCNIGCRFGKKLSALDWTLPRAQAISADAVRILADCRVEKVLMRGSRASGVSARLGDGTRLKIRADTVVLSAGALASSVLLQRSSLGEGRAGNGLAFNVGSPVTFEFAEQLNSERGLQMSHFLAPTSGEPGDDGVAIETWFNPVVTQSLFMPGWFDEHWSNMRRYAFMTCLGAVVGSEGNATVRAARFGDGLVVDYAPTPGDFVKIKNAIRLAAEIGLEAGAKRALPTTFRMLEVRTRSELARIDLEIGDNADVSLNSSHPQGGNPISLDPAKGVVDQSFRVYGTQNVHVCDASVFPSSITVNPQLTVMALAAYAAEEIAGPA